MSELKFTPGPWSAMFNTEEGWQVLGPNNQIVATIGEDSCESGDPCREDARLLAAAPDMYQALKVARRELHACQAVIHLAGGFDPAYVNDAQRALMGMDAILAKATA